jgi:predicted transcriptional regulator
MYKERLKFELYLELLTQVKNGNCNEATLMKCTNLSQDTLHQKLEPLLSERLLKSEVSEDQDGKIVYHLTDKGDQFIDFLGLAISSYEQII